MFSTRLIVRIVLLVLMFESLMHQDATAFSIDFCSRTVCHVSITLCFVCKYWHQGKDYTEKSNSSLPEIIQKTESALMASASGNYFGRNKGGTKVPPGEAPWVVSLKYRRPDGRFHHYCGGALVSPRHVLTSATCVAGMGPERIIVGVGDTRRSEDDAGEMFVAVVRISRHPSYLGESAAGGGDLAVVELVMAVPVDRFRGPIALPPPSLSKALDKGKFAAVVFGWGARAGVAVPVVGHEMRKGSVRIVEAGKCRKALKGSWSGQGNMDNTLCAVNVEAASGCVVDAGGPLVALAHFEGKTLFDEANASGEMWAAKKPFLLGISTWGPQCYGYRKLPGVYTDVRKHEEWIKNELGTITADWEI